MNLLDQAELDNAFILEDVANGFARSITYTLAAGTPSGVLTGQVIRRGTKIDVATGMPVASDEASVTIRIKTFQDLFGAIVPAAGDRVAFADSTGAVNTYRVPADGIMLDRTAGRATLTNLKRLP